MAVFVSKNKSLQLLISRRGEHRVLSPSVFSNKIFFLKQNINDPWATAVLYLCTVGSGSLFIKAVQYIIFSCNVFVGCFFFL